MTALLLLAWALTANNPSDLSHPWSGWFIALFVCALLDVARG